MIAVGIDVSKSKSTVAILNGDGSIRAKPFDVHHVADELQALVDYIKRTSEPPTILMEPTSHYHYPLLKAFTEAELPVCLINPYQMKKYGDTELRKAKTDKRDSLRIAQYALEKSYSLIPYTPQCPALRPFFLLKAGIPTTVCFCVSLSVSSLSM